MADGVIIAAGKTKIIRQVTTDTVEIVSKHDITAGDGAKHDILENKAELSTRTTSNVFQLLRAIGMPVAYHQQLDEITFSAPLCRMLPWEVVVRRKALGSYLKRYPRLKEGKIFTELQSEFFLKTKGRRWCGIELPCDDPLALVRYDAVYLYEPSKPFAEGTYFIRLKNNEVYFSPGDNSYFAEMDVLARHAFQVIERAFSFQDLELCDFKVEFGLSTEGELLLADVIDNDSWRVMKDGKHLDKQVYRDGGSLETVLENYKFVASATDKFPGYERDMRFLTRSFVRNRDGG